MPVSTKLHLFSPFFNPLYACLNFIETKALLSERLLLFFIFSCIHCGRQSLSVYVSSAAKYNFILFIPLGSSPVKRIAAEYYIVFFATELYPYNLFYDIIPCAIDIGRLLHKFGNSIFHRPSPPRSIHVAKTAAIVCSMRLYAAMYNRVRRPFLPVYNSLRTDTHKCRTASARHFSPRRCTFVLSPIRRLARYFPNVRQTAFSVSSSSGLLSNPPVFCPVSAYMPP